MIGIKGWIFLSSQILVFLLVVESVLFMISRAQKLRHTLIFPVDSSSSSYKARTFMIHGSSTNFRLSDLDFLVSKVPIGSTQDEVVQSLARDERCNRVKLTHQLFDKLLQRFKDDWKSALGVFRWAQTRSGYEHASEAYAQMIDILGKMKEMDRMNSLLREMRGRGAVTLGSVAKAMRRLAGAGRWEEAVRLFDELGTLGLDKNTESMNLLLDTLCKANRVDKARGVFLELKPHISPNANTFNVFVHGWCKVGRAEEAHWTIQEMKGHGFRPCVISYSIIVKFHCSRGDFGGVYRVLDEMRAEGCALNIVTHTTVMSCLAKLERFEEALRIAERARSDGCERDVLFYNSLIYVLGRAGRVGEAVRVFEEEMSKDGIVPNTSTYNTMIAMFCHNSEEKKARDLLGEMGRPGVCGPDVQTYYPLLKSCFRTGRTDGVLTELLEEMVKKHHLSLDLSAYSLLIHGLCRANKCEWAYHLFAEMVGRGIAPRYKTCRLLSDEAKDKHLHDVADKVEDYMKTM